MAPPLDGAPAGTWARLQRRQLHERVVDAGAALVGLGFGATLGLAVTAETPGSIAAPGGLLTAVGRLAGLAGAYLLLVMVLLMARIPAIERAVGQDRLARWHRRVGLWPLALITVHALCITLGYAQAARTGFWSQVWTFLTSYPDVLAATVAFGLLVLVGVASVRFVRRRLRYETWWVVHLYVYLALALAFAHQLATGAPFVGHPLARWVWSLAWAATAGVALAYRVGLPLWRSLYHRLRVVGVQAEAPGVVSIVCAGRHLERLKVEGGQFFLWRFLARGLWWQAHPYSLSALPRPPYLRVTVRALGDHSRSLATLAPGTPVAIEGPYGVFTGERRVGERVLLVGAGVGVTPLRAILEDLPPTVDVVVLLRATRREDLPLHEELSRLVEARRGALHEVIGPRQAVRLDAREIRRLVPDVVQRDVYLCGPEPLVGRLEKALHRLGVREDRVHRERFAF
ncbi:MAG TPA: ferredoxin reductase family protein [Acidimicrobiales bacterium]|nr:ferredoxin reductase family protein [Acidimicrobiales bacterium]